jgi:hypothetical protein
MSLVSEKLAAEEYFEYDRLKCVVYRKHLPPHGLFHDIQKTPPLCGYGIKPNAVLIDRDMEIIGENRRPFGEKIQHSSMRWSSGRGESTRGKKVEI